MSRTPANRRNARRIHIGLGVAPDGHHVQSEPWSAIGRAPKRDLKVRIVTDDWPTQVPVTSAEVDVVEASFGDLINQLFGLRR